MAPVEVESESPSWVTARTGFRRSMCTGGHRCAPSLETTPADRLSVRDGFQEELVGHSGRSKT